MQRNVGQGREASCWHGRKNQQPFAGAKQLQPTLSQFIAHAQFFERIELLATPAQQIDDDTFPGLDSLSRNGTNVLGAVVACTKPADLFLAAFIHVEPSERLDHGQHDITRFAISGFAIVPHAIDVIPLHNGLLRVFNDDAVNPLVHHVGNQFLDDQIPGRLSRRDKIGLIVTIFFSPDRKQIDVDSLLIFGFALRVDFDANLIRKLC